MTGWYPVQRTSEIITEVSQRAPYQGKVRFIGFLVRTQCIIQNIEKRSICWCSVHQTPAVNLLNGKKRLAPNNRESPLFALLR